MIIFFQYCLVRLKEPNKTKELGDTQAMSTRDVFITWTGGGIKLMEKAKKQFHKSIVEVKKKKKKNFFFTYFFFFYFLGNRRFCLLSILL
jgi:hypothetical protein